MDAEGRVSLAIEAAVKILRAERDELEVKRRAIVAEIERYDAAVAAIDGLHAETRMPAPAGLRGPIGIKPPLLTPAPVRVQPAMPASTICERPGCSAKIVQPAQGRQRHYCSVSCGKKARKAGVAVTPAPGPQRMPRADRPVDDAELDALFARSKRGAA